MENRAALLIVAFSCSIAATLAVDVDKAPIKDCLMPVCPPVDCPNPIKVIFDESKPWCPTCLFCPPTTTPTPCLVFDCIISDNCTNQIPTFFTLPDGTRCEGCPACAPKDICDEFREGLNCPELECSKPFQRSTFRLYKGQVCRGCSTCPKKCPPLNCPDCAPPPFVDFDDATPVTKESGLEGLDGLTFDPCKATCPPCN